MPLWAVRSRGLSSRLRFLATAQAATHTGGPVQQTLPYLVLDQRLRIVLAIETGIDGE